MLSKAPNNLIATIGENGQFINVIPSLSIVWVRMGDASDDSPVSFTLNNEIWAYLNKLECKPLSVNENELFQKKVKIYY